MAKAKNNINTRDNFMSLQIENHETAAWISDWEKIIPESQVLIPTEYGVQDAKEWVDSTQL